MWSELHLLRPWWLLALLPLILFGMLLWRQTSPLHAWSAVCDKQLLAHLLQKQAKGTTAKSYSWLLLSTFLMVCAMAGPSWVKLPVPTYKTLQPRVILLDMSQAMMSKDLTPNRLSRAKFKLHDLFARKAIGQFGLIAFTGEPFVVSPLTDDGKTIISLLTSLTPDVMPVSGQNLSLALQEAAQLIQQAGYKQGQILVLTSNTPAAQSLQIAKKLAQQGINSSIMPVQADKNLNPLYQRFAQAGDGQVLPYSADSKDLDSWIANGKTKNFALNNEDDVPLWRDDGRWFITLALLCLLPAFQRGRVQRLIT